MGHLAKYGDKCGIHSCSFPLAGIYTCAQLWVRSEQAAGGTLAHLGLEHKMPPCDRGWGRIARCACRRSAIPQESIEARERESTWNHSSSDQQHQTLQLSTSLWTEQLSVLVTTFFNGCRSTLIAASLLDARGQFFRPAVKDSGICDIFCIGRFFLDIFWGVFCSRFSTTLLSRTKCGSVGLIPRSGHCPAAPMSKAGQGLKEAAWPNPDLVDKRSVAVTSRREIWNVVSSLL